MQPRSVQTIARLDERALASVALAGLAAACGISFSAFWIGAAVLAIAAIALALSSRRRITQGAHLRGSMLSLLGFLLAAAVLLSTLGPRVITILQYLLAPTGAAG